VSLKPTRRQPYWACAEEMLLAIGAHEVVGRSSSDATARLTP
jgi:hypothetical protein